MSPEDVLIRSLRAAVAAAPEDLALRLHLAELLIEAGEGAAAVAEIAVALQQQPDSVQAQRLMVRVLGPQPMAEPEPAPEFEELPDDTAPEAFDWRAAEEQVRDLAPAPFLGKPTASDSRPTVTLADVGGMEEVKQRLDAALLAPLRNPELSRLYGKSLRGGLLLYGPPGCGKTFLARAVAGELGAHFISVGLSDVLDMWLGNSERNLHETFATARRNAPCVLFLDEIDALGHKRGNLRNNGLRPIVNQLLTEMDDVQASNDGVFVLAATNHPWDVDTALRRPGRLDRTLLVLPPDREARKHILRTHFTDRPVAGIDLDALADATDGFSGADLAHLCETAAERALLDSARSGQVRMIEQRDAETALAQLRPSTGPWFEAARSVALFANEGGAYDELAEYLRTHRML
ncbi:ATP-binding protein [Streptomyces sp. NPDC020096]